MNDFERLLHGVLDGTNNFWDARYIGRACYAPITEDLRIKAEFQSTLVAAQYNALKLTAISNKNGVIDTLTLHFSDRLWEKIHGASGLCSRFLQTRNTKGMRSCKKHT